MSVVWRLALRDLRGGLVGLRLLAICLFLGVAAIAGVGSLSSAIVGELRSQGRVILGGDLSVSLSQRQATPDERAAIARLGRVSESAAMRAMASRSDGAEAVLAELKAVDAAYPLYGTLTVAPGAIVARPGGGRVLIAPALAERLRVRVGDPIRVGEAMLTVGGIIAQEPDRVGEGFSLGPAVLVDMAGLRATQLVQPGSLYRWRYRVALPAGRDAVAVGKALDRAHPDAGWRVQDSSNSAPGTQRFIERIGQFLALVGLTALLIAGIGVGNGVGAYLDGKRAGIATLKTLGASSATIFRIYLIQIGLVSAAAVLLALVVGACVPSLVVAFAGDALPVAPGFAVQGKALTLAAVYGLLIAFAFALAPLARARAVGAASLFRGGVEPRRRPPWWAVAAILLAIGGVAAIAVASAREPIFAAGFLGGAGALLLILAVLGIAVRAMAARLPRSRRPLLRLAIANLHAPAAQTDRLVVALGLGLSLFATLAVIQTNLNAQIRSTVPAKAPGFFMLDIPSADLDRFRTVVARAAPDSALTLVPSLRGPVVAVKGVRVADMKAVPEGAWILRGDRGLTFAQGLPAGNRITEGQWWPVGYAGPPLVSMDAEAGRLLGLKIGDAITVSALGVEVPATIASFRDINWDSLGFNFVMIFSPGTFDGAPFNYMATLSLPPAREAAVNRAVTAAFPSVSLIRVKDVIDTVGTLLGQLATAVAAASGVAIAAGIAVLVGAIAASRAARVYDALLLKMLGARRAQVLAVQAIEYAILAAVVSLIALAVGTGAGWYVVVRVFRLEWAPDWGVVLATLGSGVVLILGIGLVGAWPALAARPARALREM
ncbi:MAG TPA: FtsX-like permease family protein [Sphingomonas sp.]|uniref:ABC transporter permease n=1 Tax=Sphingomonas sp. TaxID=28214 RepID=UPI002EDA11EE